MHAVNFAQNDAERAGSDLDHRTLSKLFRLRTTTLLPAFLICLLVPMCRATSVAQTVSQPTKPAAQSDAQKAFEKLKTLAGSWQGTIVGISMNFTIRVVSSRTAILHEGHRGNGEPPDHEITMFYRDGDRLLATHYCDAGNRSNLEGKMSPDGKSIEFSLLDVAGSTKGGFLKRLVITMIDTNHHTVALTFVMPDGKTFEGRGDLQRTQ